MKINFSKSLPHLFAIVLFIVIPFIYFSPILQGKVLNQSDIVQSKGMEHERETYKEKDGHEIYWTNAAFGGMPTYLLGSGFHNDYMLTVNKVLNFLPRPANFLFLYFISFYILMLVMKVDWKIAIISSLAFGFSTYYLIIIGVGHLAKVRAIAYFPLVIAGILLVFERKKIISGFILTTLAVALEINTKHYQMTYYLMFVVLILGLFYLIDAYKNRQLNKFFKQLGVLLFAALLALGMNATNILPAREYVKHSIRGKSIIDINPDGSKKTNKQEGLSKDYITEYSYGIPETLNLLIPRFMGGSNSEKLDENSHLYEAIKDKGASDSQAKDFVSHTATYWGKQPIVAAPAYIGAVIIFLAVLGLFFYNGKQKKWIVSAIIVALLLSWGKNLNFLTDFFIDYIPLYNKFRAVSSIQVIVEFLIPVMAALGLYSFVTSDKTMLEKQKKLVFVSSIFGGIIIFFMLFGSSLFDFSSSMDSYYNQYGLLDALIADRQAMLFNDSLRSLILILLTAGLLYLYLKKKFQVNMLYIAIGLLILFDLVGVDKRYVNQDSFVSDDYYSRVFTPSPIDKEILKDKSYYRLMNFTRNPLTDGLTSYFHKQLGGYHAAKPRRIQDLFDIYLSKKINPNILNMYNVKYLIVPNDKQTGIQVNPDANGNAWFVKQLNFVDNEEQEILKLDSINTKDVAVLQKKYQKELNSGIYRDSTSYIKLTGYHPEKLSYESNNKQNGFAVFSENYYKDGWQAFIDQKPTKIYKVDYSLRGLLIPAGKHQISFVFDPKVVKTGGTISLISFIIFLLLTFLGLYLILKKQKQ